MKQMQGFHNRIFSTSESITPLERRLARLTLFSRDRVNSVAAFDPWYVWGAEAETVGQL